MTIKGKNITELKVAAKANIREHYGFPGSAKHIALVAVTDTATREFLAQGLSAIGLAAVLWEPTEDKPAGKRRRKTIDASIEIPVTVDIENIGRTSKIDKNRLYGFDFVLWDDKHTGLDLVEAMSAGVTPIVPEKNALSGMLKQFDPMQFSGNAFLFREPNPFLMFAAAVGYLENAKFPEDKRILLKNVLQTF